MPVPQNEHRVRRLAARKGYRLTKDTGQLYVLAGVTTTAMRDLAGVGGRIAAHNLDGIEDWLSVSRCFRK